MGDEEIYRLEDRGRAIRRRSLLALLWGLELRPHLRCWILRPGCWGLGGCSRGLRRWKCKPGDLLLVFFWNLKAGFRTHFWRWGGEKGFRYKIHRKGKDDYENENFIEMLLDCLINRKMFLHGYRFIYQRAAQWKSYSHLIKTKQKLKSELSNSQIQIKGSTPYWTLEDLRGSIDTVLESR